MEKALESLSKQELIALINQKNNALFQQNETLSNQEDKLNQQKQELAYKDAQIAWYKRMYFGQKRERFLSYPDGQLSLPFEVDTAQIEAEVLEAKKEREASKPKEKKSHPGRLALPTHLEIRETTIEPEGDLSEMICIGQEITEELEVEPAKYYIHRIIRKKYAPKSGQGTFKIAELPDRVIEKGMAGASIITQAIVDKYVDHLPIYRQLQRFAREGIEIKEATLYNWVQKGLEKLEILYDYQWNLLLQKGYLQVDETTIKILESEKKNAAHLGYFWVYNDPVGKTPMFRYEKGRSGMFVSEQLRKFQGFLQTDGYAGYEKLATRKEIIHLGCWAHLRREFDKALPNDKLKAETALQMIQQLYQVEKEAKELDFEQRKEYRLEKSLPILNAFFKWIAHQNAQILPKSQIGKAFNYAIKRYDSLMAYLVNGELKIDNNSVENAIRPVAIGRKNYLFCKTHESAQRAAIIYSFMAICKNYNVNPFEWLKNTLLKIDNTSIQKLHTLLPQNFKM